MTTLVVTDLDGTVWDKTLLCHPAVVDAVHELTENDDVELLVATGRRRNSARRAYAANGFELPSVLLNGAIGFDFAADEIFHQVSFGDADLTSVLALLRTHDLGPVAYLSDTQAFVVEGVTTSVGHLDSLGDDLVWTSFEDLAGRVDVLGMCMLGVEVAEVERAVLELDEMPGVQVAAYSDHLHPPYSVMMAPADVTKEIGIRAYLEHRSLTPDRIIAVGDGGNDLEMLAMADVAIVVKDADPRATALADHIIDRPEHGGWASIPNYL